MKRLSIVALALAPSLVACISVEGVTSSGSAKAPSSTTTTTSSARGEKSKATAAWDDVVRRQYENIETVQEAAALHVKPSSSVDQQAGPLLKLYSGRWLDEVAEGCKSGKFDGETTTRELRAKAVCPQIGDYRTILKDRIREIGNAVAEYDHQQQMKRADDALKTGTVYVADLDGSFDAKEHTKVSAQTLKPMFDAIGEPLPDLIAGAEEAHQHLLDVVAQLVAQGKVPAARGSDPGVAQATREIVSKRLPVVSVVVKDSEWSVVRSATGAILKHAKQTAAVVHTKVPGVCAVISATVTQDYSGTSGAFMKGYLVDPSQYATPVKCP